MKLLIAVTILLIFVVTPNLRVQAEEPLSTPPTGDTLPASEVPTGTGGVPTAVEKPTSATPEVTTPPASTPSPVPAKSTPQKPVTTTPTQQNINQTPLPTPTSETLPEKSNTNLIIALVATIAGLLGGAFVFLRTKNSKKNNSCQKIKDELNTKKSELKTTTGKISIQEKLIAELKKKAEDKKEELKDRAINKAKEIAKKKILKLEEGSTANKAINFTEQTIGMHNTITGKIEQAQNLIEALKNKQQDLTKEVQKLESDYKTCMIGGTISKIAGGGKIFNPLNITPIKITYFAHGTTVDNEKDISSGWSDVELSELGVKQSIELKEQIKDMKFDVVFCSDFKRAVDSAKLAFGENIKIIQDARLRECNYGELNGHPSAIVEPMQEEECIINKFPEGESYEDVKVRVADFLKFLKNNYAGKSVAIITHKAPQLALDVLLRGKTWKEALAEDWRKTKAWRPGWKYEL